MNGSKIFITNGFYADTYFVTAMTDIQGIILLSA